MPGEALHEQPVRRHRRRAQHRDPGVVAGLERDPLDVVVHGLQRQQHLGAALDEQRPADPLGTDQQRDHDLAAPAGLLETDVAAGEDGRRPGVPVEHRLRQPAGRPVVRVGRTDHEAGDVPRRRSGHEEPLAGLDVLHRPQRHRPEQVVVDVHGVEGTRGRRRPVRATRATVDVEGHRPAVEVEPVADEGQVAAEQDDVGGRQLLQPPLVVLVDRGGEITGIGRLVREHPQRGGPDLPVVADDDDPGQRPPGAEHQDHQDERRHDPEAERKAEQERGEGGEHHAAKHQRSCRSRSSRRVLDWSPCRARATRSTPQEGATAVKPGRSSAPTTWSAKAARRCAVAHRNRVTGCAAAGGPWCPAGGPDGL